MAPLNWNQLWKKDISLLIILMVVVPIAGELNFHPFNDTFRVSFGTPLFFFYYYFKKNTSSCCGILVGICVVLFRVCLDWVMQGSFHMTESFYLRYPVFFYYFIYGSLFHFVG